MASQCRRHSQPGEPEAPPTAGGEPHSQAVSVPPKTLTGPFGTPKGSDSGYCVVQSDSHTKGFLIGSFGKDLSGMESLVTRSLS